MRRLVLLAFMLGAPFLAAAAGEHPWQGKRIYYVTHYLGQLHEKGFFVRHAGSYRKAPCVVTEEEKFVFAPGNDQSPVQAVKVRTLATPAGAALQRHETVRIGLPGQEIITVADGEARFQADGSFGEAAVVPTPDGVLFEIGGEWLASQPLREGYSCSADVLDRTSRSVVRVHVDILRRLSAGNAATPAVWLAELAVEGRPAFQARFTDDGRLLRLDSSGLVYHVVGREDYERGRLPAPRQPEREEREFLANFPEDYVVADAPSVSSTRPEGDVSIAIGETIPAWDNFAWVNLQADPAHEWSAAMISSDYSQIAYTGTTAVITAVRNAPRIDANAVFPMASPPELLQYLAASESIPSASSMVIDTAYNAVYDTAAGREESNIIRAVSYIAGWIHQTIAVDSWSGYDSSALDALTRLSGDSLAHARLFAAMARTLGVPSRLCQGFLTHSGRAVLHFWAEAWINGSWIPVDTTVSRVGLPAGYVLAERTGGDGRFHSDFAGFMRNPQLSLRLLSAGRDTPGRGSAELIAGDRRSYAYSEGDWMANLYWGFALRLPAGWNGRVRLDSVEMASPDRSASVKCEALAGNYLAGEEELRSNVASLRANLDDFRVIEERVVSFDADGATPALFMDFTCVQAGARLRCRQYVVPRRQRAFRISFWAPADGFERYIPDFEGILATFEF